jgi:hypothetical protein
VLRLRRGDELQLKSGTAISRSRSRRPPIFTTMVWPSRRCIRPTTSTCSSPRPT